MVPRVTKGVTDPVTAASGSSAICAVRQLDACG